MIEDLDVVALYNIRLNGWLAHPDLTMPPIWWSEDGLSTKTLWFCSYDDFIDAKEAIKRELGNKFEDLEYDIENKNILVVPIEIDLKILVSFDPDFINAIILT